MSSYRRAATDLAPRPSLSDDVIRSDRERRGSEKIERELVRRVSVIEPLQSIEEPGSYIKPADRYKYDRLIIRRRSLLQKSLPANWVRATSYRLNPALSAGSRRMALNSLIEMNSAKRTAQGNDNSQQQLQTKINKFLETL